MAISDKQRELDEIKWHKSVEMCADACGTFDYCEKCDKNKENPCELAYVAYHKPVKKTATKVASTKKETKTTKKSTTKKTATKKSTTKKTTSKKASK